MDRFTPQHALLVNLLLRYPEHRRRGGADVQDLARGNRDRPDDARQRGEDAAQPLAQRLELSFRLAAGGPLSLVSKRALDGGGQPNEIRLHHVVDGAALERVDGGFLAYRSRDEDQD